MVDSVVPGLVAHWPRPLLEQGEGLAELLHPRPCPPLDLGPAADQSQAQQLQQLRQEGEGLGGFPPVC